jgi:hypothetical protein
MVEYNQTAVNLGAGFKKWTQEPKLSRSTRQAVERGLVAPEIKDDVKEYAAYFQVKAIVHAIQQGNKQMAGQLLSYSNGTKKYRSQLWQCFILNSLPGKAGSCLLRSKKKMTRRLDGFSSNKLDWSAVLSNRSIKSF